MATQLELRYSRSYQLEHCIEFAILPAVLLPVAIFAFFSGQPAFGVVLLVPSTICGWAAIGYAFAGFDRSIKLSVDQVGIHDFICGEDIPWGRLSNIDLVYADPKSGCYELLLTLSDGSQTQVCVSGFEMAPKAIARKTKAIWKKALAEMQRVSTFDE
jgi:hypothetical protein